MCSVAAVTAAGAASAAAAALRRPNIASSKSEATPACHDAHVITSALHFDVNSSLPPEPQYSHPATVLPPVRPQPAHLAPERTLWLPSCTSSEVTLNQCCALPSAPSSPKFGRMGLSKEQRIGILLGIDGVFFLIELSVGTLQITLKQERSC